MVTKYIYISLDTTGPCPEEDEDILRVSLCIFSKNTYEEYRDSFVINHYVPDFEEYLSEDVVTKHGAKGDNLFEECANSTLSYDAVDRKIHSLLSDHLNDGDKAIFVSENTSITDRFCIKKLPRLSLLRESGHHIDMESCRTLFQISRVKYVKGAPHRNNLQTLVNSHATLANMKEILRERG